MKSAVLISRAEALRSPARALYGVRCTSDFGTPFQVTVAGGAPEDGGVVLDAGTYETRVHGGATTYRYSTQLLATDEHGDQEASATVASTGKHSGGLQWRDDRDVFRFDVEPEHIYISSCVALSGTCGTGLHGGAHTQQLYPAHGLTALDAGAAYATVSGGPGEYVLRIQDRGIDEDGSAVPVMTEPQPGIIHYPDDKDCYLRPVEAGKRYRVSVTGASNFIAKAVLGAPWEQCQAVPFSIYPTASKDARICVRAPAGDGGSDAIPYTLSVLEG